MNQREAELVDAHRNTERVLALVAKGTVSAAQGDDARASIATAEAQLDAARAQLEQARRNPGLTGAKNTQLRAAEVALAEAQLPLSYTRVTAPADGVLGEVDLRPGTIVTAGRRSFHWSRRGAGGSTPTSRRPTWCGSAPGSGPGSASTCIPVWIWRAPCRP